MTHVLEAPLRVPISRNKDYILNLNNFRNAHYLATNKAKIKYKEAMKGQIELLPKMEKVRVTFTIYPKTRRLCDIPNVCCIHDKFFMDALVELGRLPEDDYTKHIESRYKFGHVDKHRPRCSIEIEEVEK